MNADTQSIVQILVTVAVLIVGVSVIARATAFVFDRLRARSNERPRLEDDRLRHLEQAVDAIALEVERISEAQRFTAKVLAEREGDATKRLGA
jgi:hypothetical protein